MIFLGIDVSKARLDAALWLPGSRKWYASKTDNDPAGIAKLLRWACEKAKAEPSQLRAMLEATGVYHQTCAEQLHDAGCVVVVANPKRVRDFAKGLGLLTKTDAVDARALARYGEKGEALPWQPPAPEVRLLRALLARLSAVEEDLQRESNRWEQAQIADTPEVVRASLQRSIEALKQEKKRLLKAIDDHFDQHPGLKAERDLLRSIPAVGPVSANHLLCLLRGRTFDSARQAAALTGLVPMEYRSGTSVHAKPRLPKQGTKLRAVLYMASVAAGKSKMAALGALSRHLVHIAYGVLKHQQPYNPALVSKMT